MEQSLSGTMILEFNGLPGSGKTTVSTSVVKMLTYKGEKVCVFNEFYKENKNNKKLIFKALLGVNLHQILLIKNYFFHIIFNKTLSKYNVRLLLALFKHFAFFNYCYRSKEYRYIILDQGIIQNLVSFSYNKRITYTRTIKSICRILSRTYSEYFIINTQLDNEIVFYRLRNRSKIGSRLDTLSDHNLHRIIEIQKSNFSIIRTIYNNFFNSLDIDTINNVEENTKLILKKVCRKEN